MPFLLKAKNLVPIVMAVVWAIIAQRLVSDLHGLPAKTLFPDLCAAELGATQLEPVYKE